MTDAKKPMAEANRISSMLNTVLGADRFPVKVDELALEYSRQCFADSPIDTVRGEDLDGFDGLLKANKARSKWLVLYNSATPSEGRKRFTIAHEFGHYIQIRSSRSSRAIGGAASGQRICVRAACQGLTAAPSGIRCARRHRAGGRRPSCRS